MAHRHTTRAAILRLGRRLRACRIAAGMSQPELGRRSLVGYKFIGRIERGETNPSVATLALIAEGLGCDLSDLFQPDTHGHYAYVALRSDDVRRAQEALGVIRSVLKPRRAGRR